MKKPNMSQKTISFRSILAWSGWIGFLTCITIFFIASCSHNTQMNQQANTFHSALDHSKTKAANLSDRETKKALDKFSAFLKGIGSADYIEKEISNVYAENAYLNDTLKTLKNRDEIKKHFIKTSKAMTSYSVEIEDIASTSQGHYVRWTMKFTAPKLAKGKEIISIGISYVVFDQDGKAILHQDYWDSTAGFFEHVPLVGGGIRVVKKRL